MFIFDAHLDLAMNAMEWNRDLRRPIQEIRNREKHLTDKPDRGNGVVSLPEMRRGNIGLCVATQIARYVKPSNSLSGWHSPYQSWSQTQGQLAWYQAMVEAGEMTQIKNKADLEAHLALWNDGTPASTSADFTTGKPIGFILSLEGADSMITPKHLERAYQYGLRAVGPGHYGPGTYAQGTDATGGIGAKGRELLKEMDQLGIILDATHLCDDSFWEAMDHFQGPVWASHNNCRSLVNHNRQYSDDQIKHLIARGAVIGGVLDAWMMVPGWVRKQSTPQSMGVKLATLIDHLDHICQIAGNANHIGLGSDLDGAFGSEQSPADLQTIADLGRYPALLQARGYKSEDITKIMHGNFLGFLRRNWR